MTTMVATPTPDPKGNNAQKPKSSRRRRPVLKKLFILVLLILSFMAGAYLHSTDNKVANIATETVNRGIEKVEELRSSGDDAQATPAPAPTPAPEVVPVVPDQR